MLTVKCVPSTYGSSPCAACGADEPVSEPAAKLITTPLDSVTEKAVCGALFTLAV